MSVGPTDDSSGACGLVVRRVSSQLAHRSSDLSRLSVRREEWRARSRMELFEAIRRDQLRGRLSIRGLAERHGVHRRMVAAGVGVRDAAAAAGSGAGCSPWVRSRRWWTPGSSRAEDPLSPVSSRSVRYPNPLDRHVNVVHRRRAARDSLLSLSSCLRSTPPAGPRCGPNEPGSQPEPGGCRRPRRSMPARPT